MTISSNVSSIMEQQQILNKSAVNVSAAGVGGQVDLVNEFKDQLVAVNSAALNVSAIKSQDEMLGSLLDIKA